MSPQRLRIVATNDFFGAWDPWPASFGRLPGGSALRDCVARLRSGQPTLWLDAGDFAQGGPLAPLTGGAGGFAAAAELGIDAAAAGNHELDWGVEHLLRHAPGLGFPLLCANAPVGLPGTALLETPAGAVGVIGLTHPSLTSLVRQAPQANESLDDLVRGAAQELRRSGAKWVVAVLHDGVDWRLGANGKPEAECDRFNALCRPWIDAVHAVVAGHTLGRLTGLLDGVPVLQPWFCGVEAAAVDLEPGAPPRLLRIMVTAGEHWPGHGRALLDEAQRTVHGRLDTPLVGHPASPNYLPDVVARALCQATGADCAVVPASQLVCQPPVDGAIAYLPAGPITEAHVLRLVPYINDSVSIIELSPRELAAVRAIWDKPPDGARAADGASAWFPLRCGFAGQAPGREIVSLAIDSFWAAQIDRRLGRQAAWRQTGVGLRDALRQWLGEDCQR